MVAVKSESRKLGLIMFYQEYESVWGDTSPGTRRKFRPEGHVRNLPYFKGVGIGSPSNLIHVSKVDFISDLSLL